MDIESQQKKVIEPEINKEKIPDIGENKIKQKKSENNDVKRGQIISKIGEDRKGKQISEIDLNRKKKSEIGMDIKGGEIGISDIDERN